MKKKLTERAEVKERMKIVTGDPLWVVLLTIG
jgi:hypothetical protein